MSNLLIQHCWQLLQLSVSSSPSQLLFAVNQIAAATFSNVLLNPWINKNAMSHAKSCNAWNQEEMAMPPTNLQRGTWHSDSLQARAWSWSKYHIFLQRTQPPDARVLHCIPCRKSPFTFRQFGYWQCAERHWDACTRRSSIFLSCNNNKQIYIRRFAEKWRVTTNHGNKIVKNIAAT